MIRACSFARKQDMEVFSVEVNFAAQFESPHIRGACSSLELNCCDT